MSAKEWAAKAQRKEVRNLDAAVALGASARQRCRKEWQRIRKYIRLPSANQLMARQVA